MKVKLLFNRFKYSAGTKIRGSKTVGSDPKISCGKVFGGKKNLLKELFLCLYLMQIASVNILKYKF